MKPLLIFQFNEQMPKDTRKQLFETIDRGFEKGALILDTSITVLSFDKEGNLNYCTPQKVEVATREA